MQLRIVPNFPFRSPLHGYRADLTSQDGEDGLIAHIVKKSRRKISTALNSAHGTASFIPIAIALCGAMAGAAS